MLDLTHTPTVAIDSPGEALTERLASANAEHKQVVLTAHGTPLGIFFPISDVDYLDTLDRKIYDQSKSEIARGDYVTLDQLSRLS